MTAKLVPVGNGFILITSEEFASGYQAGHLAYMLEKHGVPYSDEQLTALFLERLEDVAYSSPYGMGFVVGWLTTLATKGLKPRETHTLLSAHEKIAGGEKGETTWNTINGG